VDIERAQLPKTLSYPLKALTLRQAFSEVGIPLDTHVILAPSKILLDAHFWPPNARVPHERLYVRVGAVPRAEAYAARKFMRETGLPELVAWLNKLLALPARSPHRQTEHYFRQDWDGAA
jgi:hypothetical protein